jgi:Uma2 family endonuclease
MQRMQTSVPATRLSTGGETSLRNGELLFQLRWFASEVSGWRVFDSSGGFLLADGSVRSPRA